MATMLETPYIAGSVEPVWALATDTKGEDLTEAVLTMAVVEYGADTPTSWSTPQTVERPKASQIRGGLIVTMARGSHEFGQWSVYAKLVLGSATYIRLAGHYSVVE